MQILSLDSDMAFGLLNLPNWIRSSNPRPVLPSRLARHLHETARAGGESARPQLETARCDEQLDQRLLRLNRSLNALKSPSRQNRALETFVLAAASVPLACSLSL